MSDLTPKQALFVEEYLIDLNATQAAQRAGLKQPHVQGPRLLGNVRVAAAISKAMEARSKRTQITADRVLTELAKIGFSDIRKAVLWRANVTGMVEGEDGEQRLAVTNEVQLVDSEKMDDDTAAAVAEISQNATGGLKVKLYDKKAALDSLGRHLGIFVDRTEVTGKDGGAIDVNITDRDRAKAMAALVAASRRKLEA